MKTLTCAGDQDGHSGPFVDRWRCCCCCCCAAVAVATVPAPAAVGSAPAVVPELLGAGTETVRQVPHHHRLRP